MINGSMYPAGEQGNCVVTTSPSRIARSLRQCFRPAESYVARPIRKSRTSLSMAARRWWRSRDGKRVYFTNSLYASWDKQLYPDGIRTWFVKADAEPDGSLTLDPNFFVTSAEHRLHQVRLEGGDASSDSFCYPS